MKKTLASLMIMFAVNHAYAQEVEVKAAENETAPQVSQNADDEKAKDPCGGISCANHGICVLKTTGPVCACDEGYEADPTTGLSCRPIQAAVQPVPEKELTEQEQVEHIKPLAGASGGAKFSPLVLGAQLGLGFQWSARNKDMKDLTDEGSVGFSAGGWLYVNYYLTEMLALHGGLGFVGKGSHYKGEEDVEGQAINYHIWHKLTYMEIPLGVKLNIKNIRLTALILLDFALTGKTKYKGEVSGEGIEHKHKWEDDDWDNHRRFNLGLRLGAGYAIPIGPIVLVPGIDWSTHFINEYKGDDMGDAAILYMNFFFNVAVEYGFPI